MILITIKCKSEEAFNSINNSFKLLGWWARKKLKMLGWKFDFLPDKRMLDVLLDNPELENMLIDKQIKHQLTAQCSNEFLEQLEIEIKRDVEVKKHGKEEKQDKAPEEQNIVDND